MPLNLQPSALSNVLQTTGYTPLDVLKYKKDQQRQDKLLSEKREYDTLTKMYDTTMKVAQNDYGVYQEEVMSEWNDAQGMAVNDIKEGVSPAETTEYYNSFSKKVGDINKLNQNEKNASIFITNNPLLTTEQKEKAVNDRMKSVMYNDDGSLKASSEALKASTDYKTDLSKYIDMESVYKDFLAGSQQSLRQDKVTGGTSKTAMYDWQKEDKDGNIVMDLEEGTDYVKENVFQAFMSSDARKGKIEYEANRIAKKEGITDIAEIKNIQKELVTAELVARGDSGSQRIFTETRKYGSTKTPPYTYIKEFQRIASIPVPSEGGSEVEKIPISGGAEGIDITSAAKGVDKSIKRAFLSTDGKYYIARTFTMSGLRPEWVVAEDLDHVISGTGLYKVEDAWSEFENTQASTKDKTPSKSVADVTKLQGKTSKGNIISYHKTSGDKVWVYVDGELESFESVEAVTKKYGTLITGSAKTEPAIDDI